MQQYNALDEAKIVASVFAKMRAGFRVAPSQPFRVTPAFTLFKLEMRRDENLKRLDPLRLNIEQALHAARHRAGMIDDLARTVVRINLQPLQLEVNRPDPAYLPYDGARLRMEAHTALCGLYYGMRQDTPVLWHPDDPTQPHAWIAGTTGSGKTTLSLSLLASLCAATSPSELQIFINDFKGSKTLRTLTALPHVAGMATEPNLALCAIRDFHREIMHRKQFGVDGPRCVLYIDELASYSQHRDKAYRTETAELLSECARLGREYKMHLVVCTQKPTSDVIDGQIAANIPFRLVGMVTSPEQSKYATGIANVGAHLLPGRGAFVAVNGAQVTRFQAPMIDDIAAEVARIRALWGGARPVQASGAKTVQTGASTGANGGAADYTRVGMPQQRETVQPVQIFPLADKRPLTAAEAAAVRSMADGMSKNKLCEHVYGSKSSRYMAWIDEALAGVSPAQPTRPAPQRQPAFTFRGVIDALKPL